MEIRGKFSVCVIVSLVLMTSSALQGQEPEANGGIIIRVPDGVGEEPGHCIDPAKERVWLTMRRLVTQKTRGWFSEDERAAIAAKVYVSTDPPLNERISFPLMSQASFGPYPSGQVSVPVEYSLVSGLHLLQDERLFVGLSVELTLLNVRRRNRWGNALTALAEITDRLPMPGSPITQAGSYLLEFTNAAVDRDLEDQNPDDRAKSSEIVLNFDPAAKCPEVGGNDFERTGTLAVLQSSGVEGPGLVPTDKTNEYCWKAEFRPAFVLKATPKKAGISCNDSRYDDEFIPVTNDYVGFYLNSQAIPGARSEERADPLQIESIERCRIHGVTSIEDCFK